MKRENDTFRPEFLDPRKEKDAARLNELKKFCDAVDDYEGQLQELDEIIKTHQIDKAIKEKLPEDIWVYYPWSRCVARLINTPHFQLIRSSRNQNLITAKEQHQFDNKVIGIAGLNVGNPAAICMVLEGVMTKAKYTDHDPLSLSNLNRFRARIADLGINKAILTARQSFELDPFLDIEVNVQGIVPGQEKDFLTNPRLSVLVEEMDNLPLKISIREEARNQQIPVVMVTGNGANVIVDVERYDLQPQLPILNGYLKEDIIRAAKSKTLGSLSMQERVFLARDFMGEKYLTKRLRDSFKEVGKQLAGIPQLAESSFLRGAAVSYVVRSILNGESMPSGRYFLELDQIVDTNGKYDLV